MTNLDALWLRQLADRLREGDSLRHTNEVEARLRSIANNLQRLDEANAVLTQHRDFDAGYAEAMRQMLARSNVAQNPEGEDAVGERILEGIAAFEKSGRVKRVPAGKRALEDKPHQFNGRRPKVPSSQRPKIQLDLSILEDI